MSENELDFHDGSIHGVPTIPNKSAKSRGLSIKSTNATDHGSPVKKSSKKTIESQYRKLSQREHCLIRPDTYIGSIEPIQDNMFVLDLATERLVNRQITYTPGLYKIFDEILVNAADNKQRDETMDTLEIEIDAAGNTISVKNNGRGIPVVEHQEHKCYVPTLIFGHLLTGSNFDDTEKKTTGGRNGYGAKLTNIFSKKFVVECLDSERELKFSQTFEDNMSVVKAPIISKCTKTEKKKGDYTKVTFSPDLARFKMQMLDDDTVALLSKRSYDIAGSMASRPGKKLLVSLNGKKLPIKSFQDYLNLYDGIKPPVAYERIGDRWEVGVSATDGTPAQISFVNAISTSKGGSHVSYISDQVGAHLVKTIKKKNKGGADIKLSQIKNHLCIFVNCLVDNPVFDSQTKEFLSLQKKSFGSTCKLSDKFLKQVDKSDIVDMILSFAKFKADRELKKKGGTKSKKITGIPKLDDANFAGTAKSRDCTLIVTEGDSAKSLAMSGLSVVGRDFYGVFPLKGKPLNVRDASHVQVMKNEEIKNIINILGLKMGVTYDETNIKTLRYGRLMIMADQDQDGSHIKGLLINMIHSFWPSLLDVDGFLRQFITPIVKVAKGKTSKTFFTLPQYEEWRESMSNNAKGWKIKYYKGLGTSTSAEAKEYFSNLDLHEIQFASLSSDRDDQTTSTEGEVVVPDKISSSSGADLLDMVFRKSRVEDRKNWLNGLKKNTYLDYLQAQGANGLRYSDFINKELILFSKSDNARSIPHVMDGFKPSQRKVLFACFKRNLKDEIKVAQLAGYVSEHSAYHHGEASLHGTIIGMAQNFCGSNNLNLLTPAGQFGTRRMGGKDAASPRYVFTKLEKITRAIFHPDDDELLNYLSDDGVTIEPEYYVPVIPMVLVNGSDGIGTGWSSSISNHDPRTIISNIKRLLNGEEIEAMRPFYYGFEGEIAPLDNDGTKFSVEGKVERVDDTTLIITELPIRTWTQSYKEFLEKMMIGEGKNMEPQIKDFKENHTESRVHFTIIAEKAMIDEWEKLPKGGLYAKFKLVSSLTNSNMNLFDSENRITKYEKPEDILKEFFDIRMDFYVRRKELLLQKLRKEEGILSNKARFIEEVCSGDLVISNRKKQDILHDLNARGYNRFDDHAAENNENDEDEVVFDSDFSKGYEYLLGMKLWALTFEKAEQLRLQLTEKSKALLELEATPPSTIWMRDLEAIEDAMDERDMSFDEAAKDEEVARSGKNKGVSKSAKRKTTTMRTKVERQKTKQKGLTPKASSPEIPDTQATKKVEEKAEKPSLAERMSSLLAVPADHTSSPMTVMRDEGSEACSGKKRLSPRNEGGERMPKASRKKDEVHVVASKTKKEVLKPKTTSNTKRKAVKTVESDDEMSIEDDSENESVEVSESRSKSRRVAAKQKVVYAMSSSEDEWSEGDY